MEKKKKFSAGFLVPSIGEMLFIMFFLALFLDPQSSLLNDGDTAWHIRIGEYILDNHSVPYEDIYSYRDPAIPFTAHEWLSELIMAVIYRFSGLNGLVIFFAFTVATIYFVLFRIVRARSHNILIVTAIVLLIQMASKLHWLARPHIFSLLLFLIYYHVLNLYQVQNKNRMVLLVPLMLVWINLHGGFVAGFLLLGIFLTGNVLQTVICEETERFFFKQKAKTTALVILGCLIVCLINPYGYHLILFPFKFLSQTFMVDNVQEFLSTDFHLNSTKPFELILLLSIAVIAMSKTRLKVVEVLLFVVFLHMALFSVRYILLFVIILAPMLTRQIEKLLGGSKSAISKYIEIKGAGISEIDQKSSGFVWILVVVIAVSILTAGGKISHSFDDSKKPLAAIDFLMKEKIPGNMMNQDEFGNFLIYKAYPKYRVFIDGRLDMYGEKILKEYFDIMEFKPGYEEILEKYDINWIMIPSESALSRFLLINDHWKLIYSDKVANIFIKNIDRNQYLILEYRHVKPYKAKLE